MGTLWLSTGLAKCLLFPLALTWTSRGVSSLRMPPPANHLARKQEAAEISCSTCKGPAYSQGLDTYRVPMALHELNRARLTRAMVQKIQQQQQVQTNGDTQTNGEDDTSATSYGVILLQGGKQTTRYDTDHEPIFRQESYFHWTFGVSEADVYGAISLPSGNATLFVPQYGVDYEIFCGASPKLDDVQSKYGVENVLPLEELPNFVDSQLQPKDDETSPSPQLYLLSGLNTDSGNMAMPAHYDGISKHSSKRNTDLLFDAIAEARVYKTAAEIDLMRYTHWVSSMAHVEVMRSARVGMMEYQLESLFQHHTYTHGGARHMSYTCICACGPNPAILHYGHAGRPNNRLLQEGDTALLDMGAEYHCYASDITCSFPVNGKFTPEQRIVYEAVLAAQVDVIAAMKPGVEWTEMHQTAERATLRVLLQNDLLTGDIEEMMEVNLGAVFMPHGLGHLIGLDTHDVGGYLKGTPARSDKPGLSKLRTARVLEEGMVLTVEPGCYFIDILLDLALANPKQSKFINEQRLQDFRGSGGVRLEDGVLVTNDGCENLTMCPRAIEEVLDVMNENGEWPPKRDVMPELKRNWFMNQGGRMVKLEVPSIQQTA